MTLIDPADRRFVEGSEADREAARRQWRRDRLLAQLERSNFPEIPRDVLVIGRFQMAEDTRDGRLYKVRRDDLPDLDHAAGVVAYFFDEAGNPTMLEDPPGAQSRQALEEQRAAREARRSQPRPKPSWMR